MLTADTFPPPWIHIWGDSVKINTLSCAYFTVPIIHSFIPLFSYIREVQLEKGVTSIAIKGDSREFFVGTEAAQMYRFSSVDFKAELISTSHSSAVKDVAIVL